MENRQSIRSSRIPISTMNKKPSTSRFKEHMGISNGDSTDLLLVNPTISHVNLRTQYLQGDIMAQTANDRRQRSTKAYLEHTPYKNDYNKLGNPLAPISPFIDTKEQAPIVDLPYVLPPLSHIQIPDVILTHPTSYTSNPFIEWEDSEYDEERRRTPSVDSITITPLLDKGNGPAQQACFKSTDFPGHSASTIASDALAATALHLDLAERRFANRDKTSREVQRRQEAVKASIKKFEKQEAKSAWKTLKKKLRAQMKEEKGGKKRNGFYKEHARFAQSEVHMRIERCVKKVQSMCRIGPPDGEEWR